MVVLSEDSFELSAIGYKHLFFQVIEHVVGMVVLGHRHYHSELLFELNPTNLGAPQAPGHRYHGIL